MSAGKLLFSTIDVTRQAFYRTSYIFAIVNIKPILPGHVLVVPNRHAEHICDLTSAEVAELFKSVQRVGSFIQKVYKGDGLTIACQDGRAAGQSIPHVHVHIIPRKLPGRGDKFDKNNDDIYPALENNEAALPHVLHDDFKLKVDGHDQLPLRSLEEMISEAEWLKGLLDEESKNGSSTL